MSWRWENKIVIICYSANTGRPQFSTIRLAPARILNGRYVSLTNPNFIYNIAYKINGWIPLPSGVKKSTKVTKKENENNNPPY